MLVHQFKTHNSDNVEVGIKASISLTRDGVNKLIRRPTDAGIELVRLEASEEVRRTYLLMGIIIDCVYHSGYREYIRVRQSAHRDPETGAMVMPDGPTHDYVKRPLPWADNIFSAETISGPIGPFWVPKDHHIALHILKQTEGPLFLAKGYFNSV